MPAPVQRLQTRSRLLGNGVTAPDDPSKKRLTHLAHTDEHITAVFSGAQDRIITAAQCSIGLIDVVDRQGRAIRADHSGKEGTAQGLPEGGMHAYAQIRTELWVE